MKPSMLSGTILAAAALAVPPAAARQDVALKDLMPKRMVIGLAVNQRQFEGTDATAVDIITKQFNQISPENVLKFRRRRPPIATRSTPLIGTFSSVSAATCRWSDIIWCGTRRRRRHSTPSSTH